jgi:hypothetical protein
VAEQRGAVRDRDVWWETLDGLGVVRGVRCIYWRRVRTGETLKLLLEFQLGYGGLFLHCYIYYKDRGVLEVEDQSYLNVNTILV